MKTQQFTYFIYAAGIIMTLQACMPKYVPNVLNTPMFSKAGEINMAANIGESGFDPQMSVSVSDHVGIMLNGSFANQTNNTNNLTSHTFMEVGAGYFTSFEKIARFEVYGGYGLGNYYASYYYTPITEYGEEYLTKSDVDCNRFFIQPGIGISTKYFEMSIASRFAGLHYLKDSDPETSLKGKTFFFAEPALTLKAGSKNIKGIFQIGTSILLNNIDYLQYDPLIISFGLQVKLDALARKPRKTIDNVEADTIEAEANNF